MKVKMLVLFLSLIIANGAVRAGAEGPEGEPETPVEEQKQLEEQKSSLESEQDKLRQEALKTTDPQEQQHISDQQAVLAQELKDVEAQLAATPQVTPVTPVETGIIPVVTPTREEVTQSEQNIIQSTTIRDWQSNWQKFSQSPGRIWGAGGELYTGVDAGDRATAIRDLVTNTPDSVFTQNTFEGVNALTSVARVANDFVSKKQFSQSDYDQVMSAVRQKLSQVIETGVAGKPLKDSLELLGPIKVEEAILGLGSVGARNTVWDLISQGLSTSAQARSDLLNFVSQKMVEVFRKGSFEMTEAGAQELTELAHDLLASVTGTVEPGAEVAIGDKFVAYIDAATAGQEDPTEIVEQILGAYSLLAKLDLPDQVRDRIRRKMMDRINVVINEIPDEVAHIEVVFSLAKTLGDEGLLTNSPTTIRLLSNKMSSMVTSELANHTFVAEELARGEENYNDAYQKEVDLLKQYIDFINSSPNAITPAAKTAQLEGAKRIMRINDFLEGQAKFRDPQSLTGRIVSSIFGAIKSLFASEDAMTKLINELEPSSEFLKIEGEQRQRFALGKLAALPEDILIRIGNDIDQAQKQAEAAQTPGQMVDAINALLKVYTELQAPLVRDGSKAYGFKELLARQQDIDRYDTMTNSVSKQVVTVFARYLPMIAPNGVLGPLSNEREAQERMIETMRGYLATEFKDPALADEIEKVFQATQQRDAQDSAKLIDSVNVAVSNASEAAFADISSDAFKQNFDTLISQLQSYIERQSGFSPEAVTRLNDALNDAQTWRDIASAADTYKAMMTSTGADAITATQTAYITLNQTAVKVASSMDYRQKTNWQERKTQMTKQAGALGKLAELFSQQKVGEYTLPQLADAVDKAINFIDIPDDIQKVLVEQGYFEEIRIADPSVKPGEPVKVIGTDMYAPGVRGHMLADMARETSTITTRGQQLQDYVQKNPQTPADMLVKGAANKLASDLKLSQLILDDQLTALKQQYNTALQNPLMQTAIRIEHALPLDVNTVEDATKNAATLLGVSVPQVNDPAVLGKRLGLSADTINNPTQLAQALRIQPGQMDNPRIIGARLGMTSDQIAQEPAERFSFSTNEGLRVELMQRELLSRVLQEKSEQMAKQQDAATSVPMMAQIHDILAQLRKQTDNESVDAYFEALVALKPELLKLSAADAANWSETDRLMSIMGALDASAMLELDPPTLTQQMKGVLTGTGKFVNDGLAGIALEARKLGISLVRGTGTVIKWASPVAGVLTFFLTSIGIRTAWSAGTTALASAAGTVMGPVAGIGTFLMAPGPGFLPEIAGLFSGTAAGFLMYKLGQEVQDLTKDQIAELNEDLVRRGFEKIDVTDKKGWQQASKEWVTNLFKSAMQVWSQTAASKKSDIQHKTDLFVEARTQFYEMLGLPTAATDIEVQAALAYKEAQLQLSWGINRWFAKREYNNAYRYMLRTGLDVAEANINYMTLLNQMATKVLAVPAERSQKSGLGYVYERGKEFVISGLNWFRSKILGTAEKPEEGIILKPDEFGTYKQQIDDFYQQQLLELTVLKDQIQQTPGIIQKASPFDDDTYVNMFQSLIDGRITALRDDYEQGLIAVLTEHGIKTPSKSTSGQ